MRTNRQLLSKVFGTVISIALITFMAIGCESIGHLRQAQDTFNDAAAIELEISYDSSFADKGTDQFTNTVRKRNEARTLYAASLAHLDMISEKEEKSLKSNQLYGTVLTLKALCYWKLKAYEKALDVKKEAENIEEDKIIPRDKQLLQLLTALIAIDETLPILNNMSGKDSETKKTDFAQISKILIGDEKMPCAAVCTIDSVLTKVTAHEKAMRIYALQLKLMALKRYFDAYGILNVSEQCPANSDKQWVTASTTLGQLQTAAGGGSNAVAKKLVDSWTSKIGCSITINNN